MTVTHPLGFVAAGIAAGIKPKNAKDIALVQNLGPHFSAAAVFTTNRAQANPIIWSREAVKDGQVHAVVLNSGGANCFTGAVGFQATHSTAEAVGNALQVSSGDVLVCSTGMIGVQLPLDKVLAGVKTAATSLTIEGGTDAANAILTTDKKAKTVALDCGGYRIGGMAKGAGMLAPGLATMLVVLTTDAKLEPFELDSALREATRVSFDRLDSDGCMSTNDQVTLLSSGASGHTPDLAIFTSRLTDACLDLAAQLQSDAEGAAHDITIRVSRAKTEADAVEVGRAIARNNLFKTAVFGNDPNWGRVLAAIGTTKAEFDPFDTDVLMNGVRVCSGGAPDRPREEVDLKPRAMLLEVVLNAGDESATILTNDLTKEYVQENSAYSS